MYKEERRVEKEKQEEELEELDADVDVLEGLFRPRAELMAEREDLRNLDLVDDVPLSAVKHAGYDDLLKLVATQEKKARAIESEKVVEARA